MKKIILLLVCSFSVISHANVSPDPQKTPGVICRSSDADFKGYDYPEHIARCNRNIQQQEKLQVAQNYGNIPEANWPSYEFDHLIPLCAGGANDIGNLWPQPIAEAHQKDLAVQGKYNVNFINYWVDEKSGVVMCLAESPDAKSMISVHREAHGLIPDEVHKVQQGE